MFEKTPEEIARIETARYDAEKYRKKKIKVENNAEYESMSEHFGLVYILAKRFYRKNKGICQFDDLMNVAKIGLLKGLRKYRPEEGIKVSTYIYKSIKNTIVNFIKTTRLYRSEDLAEGVCQEPVLQHERTMEDAGAKVFKSRIHEYPTQEVAEVLVHVENLEKRKRTIVNEHLKGRFLSDIGNDLGICKERVRQLHNEAISDLQLVMT